MKITGSTALVTGANRGLGASLVAALLDGGADKVYAAARTPSAIDPATADDPRVHPLALDITDQASVDAAAATAWDATLLINNAGVLGLGGVLDGDLDLFRRDLEINYLATLRLTRAFVPILLANGPSAIVNVLSLGALGPVMPLAGYCASKAAAHSMTHALRAELAGKDIEVLGAYPGGIDTDMIANVEMSRTAPESVAAHILAGIVAGDPEIFPTAN